MEKRPQNVCRSWECGTPENSRPFAKFMGMGIFIPDCSITPQCRVCFSDKLKFPRVPPADLKTGTPSSPSGSDGDSSRTSASLESDDGPFIGLVVNDEVIESSSAASSDDNKPLA